MNFRGTTIRRKIVALLLIPLVSLTAIWVFAVATTTRAVLGRPDVRTVSADVAVPAQNVLGAVQQERKAALLYAAEPDAAPARIAYQRQVEATDTAVAEFRTSTGSGAVRSALDATSRARLDGLLDGLQGLAALRQRVTGHHLDAAGAYTAYNAMTAPVLGLFEDLGAAGDTRHGDQRHAVAGLDRALEQAERQDALATAAIASGSMSRGQLTDFTFAVAQERGYADDATAALDPGYRDPYTSFWQTSAGKRLRAAQDAVVAATPGRAPAVAAHADWPAVARPALGSLNHVVAETVTTFEAAAPPVSGRLVAEALLTGGLGLVAVIASLVMSVRIGRTLIRDLTGLRREAQEVSGSRLPRVMRRLASGEQVDIEAETPRPVYADDEIGQVGQALHHLQRAAVEAAVRQAEMRRGVSDVFVNLARRSQVLLHRQLTLLDAMERRTEDAEELADLFRLDHMTTRMRRHAEGLVILSGAAASRQWRRPVRLMDVVRAAVAEVEDYERVEVRRLPRLAVAGSAVADLTHLLAELIENAAVFSPPHTQVRLHGEAVANGFVLEIDDRGLGLAADALLEANLRLAETPEFELSDTDRLGLFVVSRLARRHEVRVSLRQSSYGGTTAVVLIPPTLLAEPEEDTGATQPEAEERRTPRQHGEGSRPGFRQRGAGRPDADVPAPAAEPERAPEQVTAAEKPTGLPRRRRTTPVLVSDRGRPVAPPEDRAAPPAGSRPAEHARPEGPSADRSARDGGARPSDTAAAPGAAGSTLPRRVRQASLAPQLRAEAVAQAERRGAEPAGRERSPEEVRDRMASLQRGWLRGRDSESDGDSGTGGHSGTAGGHGTEYASGTGNDTGNGIGNGTDTGDGAAGADGGHGRDRPGTGGTPPSVTRTTPEGNGR
ncbi:sensor histidine kinase [Actinacidiphila yeochonensis]|uniref:sensor histidine kinase n=1 Tax=Actinacidiphila yeochonensis TaxID=89050 RepID=UPI00056CEAD2|nr:nitrate- and nitrite sensing domain-containing protein [Actinacidiphila yeochonensis]